MHKKTPLSFFLPSFLLPFTTPFFFHFPSPLRPLFSSSFLILSSSFKRPQRNRLRKKEKGLFFLTSFLSSSSFPLLFFPLPLSPLFVLRFFFPLHKTHRGLPPPPLFCSCFLFIFSSVTRSRLSTYFLSFFLLFLLPFFIYPHCFCFSPTPAGEILVFLFFFLCFLFFLNSNKTERERKKSFVFRAHRIIPPHRPIPPYPP